MSKQRRIPVLAKWVAGAAASALIVAACLFFVLRGREAPSASVAPEPAPGPTGDAEVAGPPGVPSARDAAAMEVARRYVGLFYGGKLRELYDHCTLGFASEMSLDEMRALRTRVQEQLGGEVALVNERVVRNGEMEIYYRVGRFDHTSDLVELSLVINPNDLIAGLRIRVGHTRSGETEP